VRTCAAWSVLTIAGFASGANAMTLTSPDIKSGGEIAEEQVYKGGECTGGNVSPALSWSGAPPGTKGFAVSVLDTDAPGGPLRSASWHWWVVNLPADATGLPKGAGTGRPKVPLRNTNFEMGYVGPCPPPGKPHHYQFTVYALDVELGSVDPILPPPMVAAIVATHTLEKVTLTGLYGR
jgi:Raf kinase inhibitor-like YbhB/YbcL family protein